MNGHYTDNCLKEGNRGYSKKDDMWMVGLLFQSKIDLFRQNPEWEKLFDKMIPKTENSCSTKCQFEAKLNSIYTATEFLQAIHVLET